MPPTASPDTSGPSCQAQPSLPARAIWLGLAGVLLGGILASVLQVVSAAVLPGVTSAAIMLGEVGLWCGLGGSCVVASRRFGTGSLIRDLGWHISLADLGLGPLAGIACVLTAGYLTSAFRGTNLAGSNTDIITGQRGTTIGVIVVTVIAAIGAPVFEELFFRGLLLQSLAGRIGVWAVWAQAVLFGLAHYQFGVGLGNVAVVVVTAGIGVVLGYTVHLTHRLAPGIIAHGIFNLFVTLSIIGVIKWPGVGY